MFPAKILTGLLLITGMTFIYGCAAGQAQLNKKYGIEIKDASTDHVYAVRDTSNGQVVAIPEQITGWVDSGTTLLLRQMKIDQYDCVDSAGDSQLISIRTDVEQFWIIKQTNQAIAGPMNKEEALLKLKEELNPEKLPTIPQIYSYKPSGDKSILKNMKSCE